jgi:two-component system nitrate/nitrite response regulator NarL
VPTKDTRPRDIPTAAPQVVLTPRERDVVRGVVRGRTNREMAHDLGITHQAVKNLVSSVYRKCFVRNRVELAMFVERYRLVASHSAAAKKG